MYIKNLDTSTGGSEEQKSRREVMVMNPEGEVDSSLPMGRTAKISCLSIKTNQNEEKRKIEIEKR